MTKLVKCTQDMPQAIYTSYNDIRYCSEFYIIFIPKCVSSLNKIGYTHLHLTRMDRNVYAYGERLFLLYHF